MSEINVRCIDQVLVIENGPDIFSGDLNVDKVNFSFCSKWDGLEKTAVFYNDPEKPYHVLLDENNSAIIPHEVLIDKGILYIGAIGIKDDVIRTSAVIGYRIYRGAISGKHWVENPTPTIYEQLLSKYANLYNEYLELKEKITNANSIDYDNASSKMDAVTVQGAIDEISITRLGNCYLKHENGKFYIGYDDGITEVEV